MTAPAPAGPAPSRRAAGGIVDQALSSATNFVVLLAALHLLDVRGVGAYTLAYTFDTLAVVTVRSLTLEALLIRFAVVDEPTRRAATRQAAGASLALGLLAAAAAIACSLALPGPAGAVVLAAGLVLPGMLVQDAWRYSLFSAGRPWAAAANDALCLAVTVAALAAVASADLPPGGAAGVVGLLAVWGAGMLAGAVHGVRQVGCTPDLRGGVGWLRSHGDLGAPLAGGTFAVQAAGRLSLVVVGAVAGVEAVGRMGAAMTVLSPLNTLIAATVTFAVPEAVRRRRSGRRSVDRYVVRTGCALPAAVVGFATAYRLLPAALGHVYAGRNWEGSQALLVPVALWVAGTAASQGARIGLRALDRPMAVLRVSLVQGGAQVAAATAGALLGGAAGAAWGIAAASLAGQVPWWVSYLRADRPDGRHARPPAARPVLTA